MASHQYRVKLFKKPGFYNPKLPSSIEFIVIAESPYFAKQLAEARNDGYRATDAREIKEPKPPRPATQSVSTPPRQVVSQSAPKNVSPSRAEPRSSGSSYGHSSSSGSENLGCSGILRGLITLVTLLIVLVLVSKCEGQSGPTTAPPMQSQAPNVDRVTVEGQVGSPSGGVLGMDTSPRQDAVRAQEVADEAAASSADPEASTSTTGISIGGRARVVDSRDRIVLQSGPKMSSKNVAKIETGSVVEVMSHDGKWTQVRTSDGMVGYVRQRQLGPAE